MPEFMSDGDVAQANVFVAGSGRPMTAALTQKVMRRFGILT